MLSALKLIRQIYDKLSTEELLFLIYIEYPEFADNSKVYNSIIKDPNKRKEILNRLKSKGIISEERYKELYVKVFKGGKC